MMNSFSQVDITDVHVIGKDGEILDALVDFFPASMSARSILYEDFSKSAEDMVHNAGLSTLFVFVCSEMPLLVNDFLAAHRPHLRINQVGVLIDDDLIEIWPSVNLFDVQNTIKQADIREGGKKEFQAQLKSWIR